MKKGLPENGGPFLLVDVDEELIRKARGAILHIDKAPNLFAGNMELDKKMVSPGR
jgi:hypothetical protein